ncbi:SdpI family protein [[Eubacterium] rectale]|nr:SdpI family protein [Agathobacter rectalis]
MPKIKQNNTIGIRIVLTLQDEENWNATHSFSGRIWGDIRYFMYAMHITFDKICE